MPQFLATTDDDFDTRFDALLTAQRAEDPEVDEAAASLIADVRARGDAALIDATERFDRVRLTPETLAVSEADMAAARDAVDDADLEALQIAAARIKAFHERELPQDARWTDRAGASLGWVWRPVSAAGLYVPGGRAAYPSSVLMNAIPAKVAGVERLVITVPTQAGELDPRVLVAAEIAGVDRIYRVGGAQAIAALAYGTATITPVDKITGPGNAYVAAAKRRVFGHVGIDMIAGPSEILVISDGQADPDWIAADLLSQAEHDESARAILITTDPDHGSAVAAAVDARLSDLPRREIAGASWGRHGAVITVNDLGEAAALTDALAPEHLELCVGSAEALAANICNAGAIFLGPWTPEAIGDYVGGPNHVLPTGRAARFASGLGVHDFLKRTTIAQMTPEALKTVGPAAVRLARAEGLEGHAASVTARLDRLNEG